MLAATFTTSRGVTTTPILSTTVSPVARAALTAQPGALRTVQMPPLHIALPIQQSSLNYNQSIAATQGAAQTPSAPVVADPPADPTMDPTMMPTTAGPTAASFGPGATGVATGQLPNAIATTAQSWWTTAKPYVPYAIGGLVVLGAAHFVFKHLL